MKVTILKNITLLIFILLGPTMKESQAQLSGHFEVLSPSEEESHAAIFAFADNTDVARTYGVYGASFGSDGIGTYGFGRTGLFGDGGDFGIFSTGGFRAASFSGDVEYTGMLIGPSSDEKLKVFVKNETNYLQLIKLMKVRKYNYKTNEYPTLNLSDRIQHGLVAQELEKIMPELVYDSKTIARPNKTGQIEKAVEYKTINYMGLLPITIASVQELSDIVQAQSAEIKELKKQLSLLK